MASQSPIKLYFPNGGSIVICRRTLWSLFAEPYAIFIFFFAANVVRTASAYSYGFNLTPFQLFVANIAHGLVFLISIFSIMLFFTLVACRTGRSFTVFMPACTLTAMIVNEMFGIWYFREMHGLSIASTYTILRVLLTGYVIHLGFEVLYAAAVLPRIKTPNRHQCHTQTRAIGAEPAANRMQRPAPLLLIGGEAVPPHEVGLVKADEHYVFVHYRDQRLHTREKFGNLVDTLTDLPGMQVHKSYWISFDFITRVQARRDGSMELTLRNGETIPVARTRAKAFRARYGNWRQARAM